MNRAPLRLAILIQLASLLVGAGPALAATAPSPSPGARAKPKVQQSPRFTTRVHIPTGTNTRVSSAACNRRTVGVNPPPNQLGPIGARGSQTLVAVPINGSTVAQSTADQQISEVCAHQRQ